jgi:hypothetical protein
MATTNAGANLLASVPSDLFTSSEASAIASETVSGESIPDGSVPGTDSPAVETETSEQPAADPETPLDTPEGAQAGTEEEPGEEQPDEGAETEGSQPEPSPDEEELPDGVRRGKDRNGKDGVWVDKSRWENTIHPHHKIFQQASELIGEPLSIEAIDLRNRAYLGQERLYTDLLSADPQSQSKVINHFFDEAERSRQEGEIEHDPTVSLGETFYTALRERSPDGYAKLRLLAAKDLISEMYQAAAERGDKNLWLSMGHLAKTLGLPYHRADEMEAFISNRSDPVAMLRAENERLKSELYGRKSTEHTAQFDQWTNETRTKTTAAVLSEAILPALSEAQKAWEKYPEAFNDLVVSRLQSAVQKTIAEDRNFADRISLLTEMAKRAASAQKRAEIASQIQQAYVNRARLAADIHKRKILTDAARIFKERNDANHARRSSAQNQRTPTGAGSPIPRSIVPQGIQSKPGENFNLKTAMADIARLLGS